MWNKEIETMSRKDMQALQLRRLQATVKRVYNKVPFYRKKLDEAGITPDSIKTLEDIKKIPFTVKDDLRDNYPFGLFAVPMKNIVRIHASSGTTGKPTTVGYTAADLDMWSECVARLATMAGATADDTAQIAFGYGLFTGAFGLHYGLEKIGATVIPMSSGNTEKQIMIMQDYKSTILVSTPSYALYMAEVMEDLGVKKSDICLKVGLFGAEGSTEEMRAELEKRWGIIATENYGMSELIGPGVSGECIHKTGMHINEDFFIPEIINSETGEVLPEGEFGELVITTVSKEGIPLLRYRTKDITCLMYEPCPCGRTSVRMHKIQGRTDDMLIIRGVNVFPTQVESVLLGIEHISPHYQLVVTKNGYIDELKVVVELEDSSLLDSFSRLESLEKHIRHKLHVVLGIDAKVQLAEPKTIERSVGKAKRVIDLRGEKQK
ncbi:MAG: Phenylacetate-coenzyme A ligase [Firmicutes bacterium ADurb.Bin193]|nr:MAG: Phenylacetate-coenzyme A ligase [Firmicutes bacterium ADurb.Bin193]